MPTRSEARMKREIMLEHVDRFGKTAHEIFEDFRSDYGSYGERQCWYVLAWLIDVGCVTFRGAKFIGERRYIRVRGAVIPPIDGRIRCSKCGMPGTDRRYHPDHQAAKMKAADPDTYIRYVKQRGNDLRRARIQKKRAELAARGIFRPDHRTQPRNSLGHYQRRDVDIRASGSRARVPDRASASLGAVVLPEQQVRQVGSRSA